MVHGCEGTAIMTASRCAGMWSAHTIYWLFSDRHHPNEPAFSDLAMIGMIESETSGTARPSASGAIISVPDGRPRYREANRDAAAAGERLCGDSKAGRTGGIKDLDRQPQFLGDRHHCLPEERRHAGEGGADGQLRQQVYHPSSTIAGATR